MGSGKSRSISSFMFHEMLYDYVCGILDAQRVAAMEDYLRENPEAQKEVESLKKATIYCKDLGRTQLSQPLINEIQKFQGPFAKAIDQLSFKNWPEFMRWGAEAFSISIIVALFVIFVPWQEYLQELRIQGSEIKAPTGEELPIDGEIITPVAEKLPEETQSPVNNEVEEPAPNFEDDTTVTVIKNESIQRPKVVEEVKPSNNDEPIKEVETTKAAEKPLLRGELYRAYMKLPDLTVATPQIVGLVTQLEGEKAGQVKLGWEKPLSRYFHFSMPEKNYEALVQGLRDYGPVRIYKYTHRRVMPEGRIRIILEIEKN